MSDKRKGKTKFKKTVSEQFPIHPKRGGGIVKIYVWENKNGDDVFQRWAPALQGVHQVLSFGTTSQNSAVRGTKFAFYMTGLYNIISPRTIVNSWFRACAETEGSDRLAAVFYATKSPDPNNPQLDDPINDHAYGYGYVCSDPTPGSFSWYVYITSSC